MAICHKFREYRKNTLQGFADIESRGFLIKECPVHLKNGKRWIGFPARAYKDNEGKDVWAALIQIPDEDNARKFQEEALKALDKYTAAGDGDGQQDIPF